MGKTKRRASMYKDRLIEFVKSDKHKTEKIKPSVIWNNINQSNIHRIGIYAIGILGEKGINRKKLKKWSLKIYPTLMENIAPKSSAHPKKEKLETIIKTKNTIFIS